MNSGVPIDCEFGLYLPLDCWLYYYFPIDCGPHRSFLKRRKVGGFSPHARKLLPGQDDFLAFEGQAPAALSYILGIISVGLR